MLSTATKRCPVRLVVALLIFLSAGPLILGIVTTASLGAGVFGESLGFLKLLGILVCVLGTVLIFYDPVR